MGAGMVVVVVAAGQLKVALSAMTAAILPFVVEDRAWVGG